MTRLLVNEVAPRDGLQMEKRFVPTHEKIAFVDALSACGFAKIEVTSFTSARHPRAGRHPRSTPSAWPARPAPSS